MTSDKKVKTVNDLYSELGLGSELRAHKPFRRVNNREAQQELGYTGFEKLSLPDMTGIAIAGYDLYGDSRGTYQVRRDKPEIDEQGRARRKYESRPASAGPRWINTTPGKLTKEHKTIIVVESPKSTWAVTAAVQRGQRKDIKVIDTGGLSGWRVKMQKDGDSVPNPDLALLAGRTIIHLPDSNVTAARPDLLAQAEQLETYLNSLPNTQYLRGRIPALPGVNGPDDLLGTRGGYEAFWCAVKEARPGWQWEFPTLKDFTAEDRKTTLLVDHLIADKTITLFASASENYKTMAALTLCRSMLNGNPAFECEQFKVRRKVAGVIYNCPDMSQANLLRYADQMKLAEHTFHIRTMKQGVVLGPKSTALKAAAREGYFIVLDTMGYFTGATDDYQAAQLTEFFLACRQLIDLYGAAGILALVHPTKPGARNTEIDVTEQVSGTYAKIGAVDTIFVLKRLNDATTNTAWGVYVSREKKRPFVEDLNPFVLEVMDSKGNNNLAQGRFPVKQLNAGKLSSFAPPKNKGGKPPDPDKERKIKWACEVLKQQPQSMAKLTDAMNKTFGSDHEVKTLRGWLKEHRQDQQILETIATNTSKGS